MGAMGIMMRERIIWDVHTDLVDSIKNQTENLSTSPASSLLAQAWGVQAFECRLFNFFASELVQARLT
jgi:hypothetical protein